MKRIAIIFTLACIIATLDYYGCKYDLEPYEPGYATYGGIGAICMLLAFPVLMARSYAWIYISKWLYHSDKWMWSDSDYLAVLLTDVIIVFAMARIFYGLRWLWEKMRKPTRGGVPHS